MSFQDGNISEHRQETNMQKINYVADLLIYLNQKDYIMLKKKKKKNKELDCWHFDQI